MELKDILAGYWSSGLETDRIHYMELKVCYYVNCVCSILVIESITWS